MIKKNGKKRLCLLLILSIILITTNVYSHSGRTDANGGHKDNQNKSGLGSYHYHCGGYPAHLHTNGSCLYSSSSSSSNLGSASSSTSSPKISTQSSTPSPTQTAPTSTSIVSTPVSTTPVQPKTSAPRTISPTGIKINETIGTLENGSTQKLTATITPENATDKNIVWSSSDKSIASISSTGEIVAIKPGTVDIIATTSNGLTSNLKLSIIQPPTEIKINENIIELEIEESKILTAMVNPIDAFDKTVNWESSDNEILAIDKDGKIIAKKSGKAVITAISVNGLKDTIEIIVKDPKIIENTTNQNLDTTITDAVSGLLGLGTLGGGYWVYKKNKKA